MWTPGITELSILFAVIVLLFGGKKIPEIAKGLGNGIREFKKAKKEVKISDKADRLEQT